MTKTLEMKSIFRHNQYKVHVVIGFENVMQDITKS